MQSLREKTNGEVEEEPNGEVENKMQSLGLADDNPAFIHGVKWDP